MLPVKWHVSNYWTSVCVYGRPDGGLEQRANMYHCLYIFNIVSTSCVNGNIIASEQL